MHIDALNAAGFGPCSHPSIGPASLIKQLRARDMPRVRDRIVGTMGVTGADLVFVEVQPDGVVTMGIEAVGYFAVPVPTDSDEGRCLMRDAGVMIAACPP